jgi:hypothetical protein
MLNSFKKIFKLIGAVMCLVLFFSFVYSLTQTPSNDRDWWPEQKTLAYAETNGNLVTIKNIRDYRFLGSEKEFTPGYYDKTFDLDKIKNIYYIVEKFSDFEGQAHTFLSFEFEGDNFLAITVEARKEVGEDWGPVTGMLRQYELMYVIADERDVVRLRTNTRNHPVYAYPIKTTKEKKQAMFMDMVNAATDMKDNPKFYNTLWASCTTTIVKHVNNVTPHRVTFDFRYMLPGYSGKLAYDLGMIDTDLSFEEAEKKYMISDKAREHAHAENFSKKIRENF